MNKLISEIKSNNFDNFINILKIKLDNGFNIDSLDEFGNTLLHLICRKKHYESFLFLINNGSNCLIKNKDGKLPLHITAIYSSESSINNIINNSKKENNILINNSNNIMNILITNYPESLLIKDNDGLLPLDYYNIHSNKKNLFKLNKVLNFFTLNNKNIINNDIIEKINIYNSLKKYKQFK